MKKIIFNVGTCNAQALPQHWKLPGVFSSLRGLKLWGMQEMDPERYKIRAKKKWPQMIGLGGMKDNTHSSPIGYSTKVFHLIKFDTPRLYTGIGGISYTRHATNAVFEHRKSGIELGMVNLHGPVVKKDKLLIDRKKCRAKTKSVIYGCVDEHLAAGRPVIITGDFNDKTNWFDKYKETNQVLRVGFGIDQIIYIGIDKKFSWKSIDKNSIDTPSDHNTIRSRVELTAS